MSDPKRKPRSQPAWTDIKARLSGFDRRGLMGLIQDLYAAHKENRTFLHARFGVGGDALRPYKETLDDCLWPDVFRNQDTSVAKAKQAISNYRKAVGDPAGLAELMVFYCERAAGFCDDLRNQDEGYFDALVRMFEQALKIIGQLPAPDRDVLIARLDRVRVISHKFGYAFYPGWRDQLRTYHSLVLERTSRLSLEESSRVFIGLAEALTGRFETTEAGREYRNKCALRRIRLADLAIATVSIRFSVADCSR